MKKISHAFWRFLYKFHRYAGLTVALLAIMLSITGIALNHSEDFQLDKRYVSNPLILGWYGISPPVQIIAYSTSNHWLSQIEHQIYFDDHAILKTSGKLNGAVETDQFTVAVLSNSLLMLSSEGEIIEQISYSDADKVGIDAFDNIYLQQGQQLLKSNDGLLSWQHIQQPEHETEIGWSTQASLPTNLRNKLRRQFNSAILPLERLLLDIHSGRFFGKAGVFIVDLSAVLLLLLAISGSVIWIKHRFRRRYHRTGRR